MAKRPRKWEAAFLEALEVTGTISGAAKAVEIGRQTVYDYMKADTQFSDRCRDAVEGADDELEAEARRRSVEGEQEPVFYRGQLVAHKPRKSDALLMYLLKTHDQRRQRILQRARAQRFTSHSEDSQRDTSEELMYTDKNGVKRPVKEWCAQQDWYPDEEADAST